jgi:predicted permease
VNDLARELRRSLRGLARRPGLTAAIIASVALGIGTNTAIFTVVDAIFLRPVPAVRDLDRLIYPYATPRESPNPTDPGKFSYPDYRELRDALTSVDGLAVTNRLTLGVAAGEQVERFWGLAVSPNYFPVLGLEPSLGRFFHAEEEEPVGSAPVAVLSHGCWQRLFAGDPQALGRSVTINGSPYTVIGVGPPGFQGTEVHVAVDVWVPISMWPSLSPFGEYFEAPDVSAFELIGRLAPGYTFAQADLELQRVAAAVAAERGSTHLDRTVRAMPFQHATILPRERERYLRYGVALAGAVGLVLLVCCFNVAHLLLVYGADRGREMATRQALGATRGRLVLQLLLEGLLLFALGGIAAVGAARLFLHWLWKLRPPEFAANAVDLHLDGSVLAFLFALTLAAGLGSALLPAFLASRADLAALIKGARRPTGGRRFASGYLLLVPQLALALTALVGGGLFLDALRQMERRDLGFDVDQLAVLSVAPGMQGYDEDRAQRYYQQAIESAERVPGVERAALSVFRLLRGAPIRHQVYLPGEEVPPDGDDRPAHRTLAVTPGYFETVGLELEGEDFDDRHGPGTPLVAIINRFMADQLWPGEGARGKQFSFDYPTEPPLTVIGVAENAKYRYIDEGSQFFIYVPVRQSYYDSMTLHARAAGDPAAIVTPLREAVAAVDPSIPTAEVGTLQSFVGEAIWMERSSTAMLNTFGLLALLLATVGIYGVMRHLVRRRQKELGIRMALGATRRTILTALVTESTVVIACGLGLGLIAGYALVRPLVAQRLPGAELDGLTAFLVPSLVFFAVALVGGVIPAWRAARTDPMVTLRTD